MIGATPLRAETVATLYDAQVIVTGTGDVERARGFREGLERVLIKLTGNEVSAGTPAVRSILDNAPEYIAAFEYGDRLKGVQIHDEQGTRERSQFLRMTFDRAKIEPALHDAGIQPWVEDRPRLLVWLGVKDFQRKYVLGDQKGYGLGQREALIDAAERYGVPLIMPSMDAVDQSAVDYAAIAGGDEATLLRAGARYDPDATLYGTLIVNPAGTWTVSWTLLTEGESTDWTADGVTFDAAMRTGISGAAKVFATSNGGAAPRP